MNDQAPASLSVVMPVYNGSAYLERAVRSVLAQTHRELELLVCDDASGDASLEILGRIEDPRMRVLHHEENRGLFPTLNELLRLARTEFVHVFLQDDEMYPSCLATELAFHAKHRDLALSYCRWDLIDEHGKVTARLHADDRTPDVLEPAQATELLFHYGSIAGNLTNIMLRRELVLELGGFREDMVVSGDFELLARVSRAHRIGHIAAPLLALRNHVGQLSRRRGIVAQFAREDGTVYRELLARLPAESRAQAWRYHRRHVHTLYWHDVMRSLLKGDVEVARDTLQALREVDSAFVVGLYWLLSANRRFLKPRPNLRAFG